MLSVYLSQIFKEINMKNTILFVIFCMLFASNFAQDTTSEITYSADHIKDTIQLKKAVHNFRILVDTKKYEEALSYAEKVIPISMDLDNKWLLGILFTYKGKAHSKMKDHFEAIEAYNVAESYFKEIDDIYWLSEVYNMLFVIEYGRGNLEKSADYLLEAKMYAERLNNPSMLFRRYNNLGIVYGSLKNNEEAGKYMSKAIAISKKINGVKDVGRVMNNLGVIYSNEKKYDQAKKILREAIDRNRKDSLPAYVAHSYSLIANVALLENELYNAIKYYDSSNQILKTTSYRKLAAYNKQEMGQIYTLINNYIKAERLLTQARKEFEEMEASKSLLTNYKYSSRLDSLRGNLTGALAWQQKYQKLSDEKMTELSTKKMERAESRYKAELAQLRKIDEQEKRELQTQEELLRYRIFMFVILGVLTLCLFFLFWVIKTRRERKMLISSLDKSNQIKNKLFSIISHDLKNEIHGLESSLNLMKDNQITVSEYEEIVPLLADRTHQTSILLNNLLNWSKSQLQELSAKPIKFDMTDVIKNKFAFFRAKANKKNIKLVNKIESTAIFADKDMVSIVAQNLIANAIKFCKSGDTIALVSREKEGHYEIGFQDTGIGIAPDNIKKLFAEETFTTRGTQNESGTGLGLRICKELIELNKGNIRVESTLGEGTSFYISLPKAA